MVNLDPFPTALLIHSQFMTKTQVGRSDKS